MVETKMKKWNIGVIVISLLSVGLLTYVLAQGISSKSDRATLKSAQAIAEKLNVYIDNEQKIPTSLAEANITDVPSSIVYTRLSGDKYKFCATYKSSNSDVTAEVQDSLSRATTDRGLSGSEAAMSYGSDSNAPQLYIESEHPAGTRCQTIEPYIYSSDIYKDDFGNSPSADYGNDNSNLDSLTQ